jgi:hypothetical protein
MRKSVWIVAILVLLFVAGNAFAGKSKKGHKPKPSPPPRSTACDQERGASWALCVAFCDVLDCDDRASRTRTSTHGGSGHHDDDDDDHGDDDDGHGDDDDHGGGGGGHGSDNSCAVIKRIFEKTTGRPLPCLVQCPCDGLLQLFADISSGQAVVERCIADTDLLYVVVDTGEFALVDSGLAPSCSVNAEAPFVELTSMQSQACRAALQAAAEAQGIVCVPPE